MAVACDVVELGFVTKTSASVYTSTCYVYNYNLIRQRSITRPLGLYILVTCGGFTGKRQLDRMSHVSCCGLISHKAIRRSERRMGGNCLAIISN